MYRVRQTLEATTADASVSRLLERDESQPLLRIKAISYCLEDNQEIRHYLSSGLAALFNILEAGNGEEALEKLKNHEADIIITDVMMPVMDGIKLCKNIKQNIRTCHIPVIILSAKTDIKRPVGRPASRCG